MNNFLIDRGLDPIRLIGVALLYALAIHAGLAYLTFEGGIPVLWIHSGVGLAAVLLGGRKYCVSIFGGALAAYLWMGQSLLPDLAGAAINSMEICFAHAMLSQLQSGKSPPKLTFDRVRDYWELVAVATLAALLAALLAMTVLWLMELITPAMLMRNLLHWWLSDTLSMIAVTPLILVWRKLPYHWIRRERLPETIAFIASAFFMEGVIFLFWFTDSIGVVAPPYLIYFFVIWGAVRFGRHGSLLIIWMTLLLAMYGAQHNLVFFVSDNVQSGQVNYWLYSLMLTFAGVTLALVMNERKIIHTELNRLAEERRLALEDASAALNAERKMAESQRHFVAMVSHEFRTPLAIIGATNQSLRVLIDPDNLEVTKRLDKIAHTMDRLTQLIDHTLSRERLETGLTAQIEPFALDTWLAEQSSMAQLLAPLHRVELSLADELKADPPLLRGDRHLLSVAWMNLVDNAVKYSPAGSEIRMVARLEAKHLLLEVIDAGPGIPPKLLSKLFDRFVRGSNTQGIAGSGLGLYMVKHIAELHDGTVTVVNAKQGCCATLRLNLNSTVMTTTPPSFFSLEHHS
ncbi:MAG: MASE1 domain-containing protein [Sterolibacterium sp.]|nr:MASE1 domain-containing protein [Sterolibacterium sp.]